MSQLGGIFDVPTKLLQIEDEERHTLDPNFWEDQERAQALLKSINQKKYWVKIYDSVKNAVEDLEVLHEFKSVGEVTEEELEAEFAKTEQLITETELKSTLNQEEDNLNVRLTLNAGAGGTEANDWVEMLTRMYIMWSEKNGYKIREEHRVAGDVAGIKSVDLVVEGNLAYGYLKAENGVHRLVRKSPFNAQGKRQTSFASVFVYPIVDDTIDIEVNAGDLDWDTFRSSGAGGQHVNKTESAVRLRHLPTGLVVECQDERSQHRNREIAIEKLKSLLYQKEIEERNATRDATEASKTKIEWGSQIRSYVLDDRRIKDHRTNHQTGNTDAVLNGDLNPFLKAYLMWNKK